MLEIKEYTIKELSEILNSRGKQAIDRKLERYGIQFDSFGRGENRIYDIKEIPDPFKIFCITEMRVPAVVNFEKFRIFCYYFLCDDDFIRVPILEMVNILSIDGVAVSRQAIRKWIRYFERVNYILLDTTNCTYYAITESLEGRKCYTPIPREEYSKAWGLYWGNLEEYGARSAYQKMWNYLGGHPHKHPNIIQNGIYEQQLDTLLELVLESMLKNPPA